MQRSGYFKYLCRRVFTAPVFCCLSAAAAPSITPNPQLDKNAVALFYAGKALADQPWVKSPATTSARDGLGPLYNTRTCTACHLNGGRSHLPEDENTHLQTAVLKVSLPGTDAIYGYQPLPNYGLQLQPQSVALSHQLAHQMPLGNAEIKPEVYATVHWQSALYTYPDGRTVTLRSPKLKITETGYGPLPDNTRYSLRTAPPLFGAGLLALVAQKDIEALADPEDTDRDGISGRVNPVWDFATRQTRPGRFGLKANRASLINAVAAAFSEEMGITSSLFPSPICTGAQKACLAFSRHVERTEQPEISDHLLELVADFTANIAPNTPPNQQDLPGRETFYKTGCSGCHNPSFVTAPSPRYPHLSEQIIYPYTDLLLHDLGEGLADGFPEYAATGREWRTAPLWRLTASRNQAGHLGLLHDGRARTIEEAILWHGGEAAATRDHFTRLSESKRVQLIEFLEAL